MTFFLKKESKSILTVVSLRKWNLSRCYKPNFINQSSPQLSLIGVYREGNLPENTSGRVRLGLC